MHDMHVETQHLRDAASQAIAQEQVDQQGRLLTIGQLPDCIEVFTAVYNLRIHAYVMCYCCCCNTQEAVVSLVNTWPVSVKHCPGSFDQLFAFPCHKLRTILFLPSQGHIQHSPCVWLCKQNL